MVRPYDRRMNPRVINYSRVLFVRDIMVKNGDANKPIWISEMNWNAVPEGLPAPYGRVTLEQQARYAVMAYQRAEEEWPWVGVVNFWFFKRPTEDWLKENKPEYFFRMAEPDFTLLPVYYALKSYIPQAKLMYPGFHQEDHWAVTYRGQWEKGKDERAILGEYVKATSESELEFRVKGSALYLVVAKGPRMGEIEVEVDGRTSRYSLKAPEEKWQEFIPVFQALSYQEHFVRIKANADQSHPVILDGFLVRKPFWKP